MKYKILATSKTKYLLDKITSPLLKPLIGELITERFSDKEMAVKFNESVRGCNLFLFCETSNPDNILELMFAINASYLAGARSIILITPYLGYCRQDRQEGTRGSLGAALIAKMITSRELAPLVNRVVTIDLHAEQEQGFFYTPCEHIRGHAFFLNKVRELITPNTVLMAPDAGGMKRVEKYASRLELPMAVINKRREKPNEVASMVLSGDVTGKDVIILDDIVDTCGTLKKAVQVIKEAGANSISYVATHPVLSGKAWENLNDSSLDTLIVSDTLPIPENFSAKQFDKLKIKIVSCIPIIEKVILNLIQDNSISQLNEQ